MFSNSTPFTMPVTPAYGGNGGFGGFGSDGSWLWFIIVIFAIFGWGNGGWGGNGSGVQDNYILTSDFSQLSRQISDSTAMTERKLDGVANGICSLGYDQLNQMNGINTNILTNANALGTQISDCCCGTKTMISDLNYNLATQANGITNAVNTGFCQTNYNNSNNTRDIIDAQNTNTRQILDAIQANKVEALNQRIAEQNQEICNLQLAASQQAQNNYLVGQLRPSPVPAYQVANPYCNCNYGSCCGCN